VLITPPHASWLNRAHPERARATCGPRPPQEISRGRARDPLRTVAEEIARTTRRLAGIEGAQTGSVGCPQIFGGSLNLHVHFHTIAADGVFEKTDAGGVRFHEAPPSSKDDVAPARQARA
jgi:Putative transposase